MGNASETTLEPSAHVTSETQAALGPKWARCQGLQASAVAKAARSKYVQYPSTAHPADSGTLTGASNAKQGLGKPPHALTQVSRPTQTRTRAGAGISPEANAHGNTRDTPTGEQ
jgi:hypothetical protein